MSFDLNPELSHAIHRLQEVIIQDDDEDSELAGMVDISKVSVSLSVQRFLYSVMSSTISVHGRIIQHCLF